MRFEEFVAHLGRIHGVPELPLDARGRCRLNFADGIEVEIFAMGRTRLYFEAVLDELPADERERADRLRRLLRFSLAVSREREEVLALPRGASRPRIWRRLPMDELAPDEALEELDRFVDEVELWLDKEDRPVQSAPMAAPHIIMP